MFMMKRLICILITVLMVLPLIACGDTSSGESANAESGYQEESPNEVSEPFVFSEKVEKINSFMVGEIDRSLKAKNLFRGSKYTASRECDSNYPDPNNAKLTDGMVMDIVYGYHYHAGWSGGQPISFLFDLGETKHSIADISVSCARIIDYGVGLPSNVTVQASHDGKVFIDIGKIATPKDLPETTNYIYYFSFPKSVEARYIKINLAVQEANRLLLDEICAFEYCEDGTIDNTLGHKYDQTLVIEDFYGYELNLGKSDVKVSESDADYNTTRNLATIDGVDIQIEHFEPFFVGHTNSGMEDIHMLTDGVYHGDDIENDYFKFYRGAGRHVVVDLGVTMAVDGCKLTFQDRYTWGITTPVVYYISVSENGTDWVTVFAEHNPDYGKTSRIKDTRSCEFESSYRARYVRLTFPTVPDNEISCQVYMGEFEVLGRKNPEGAVSATPNNDIKYGRYPDPKEFGIEDILWAGIGNEVGEFCEGYHVMTEDTAYRYITEFDQDGNPIGTLFDSVGFTTRGNLNWHADRNEGYSWFLKLLYSEGINLDALDAARGRLNKELGVSEKTTVFVSVNCPKIGDVFNGKKIETADDYISCLKWMADSAISEFNKKGYVNIELRGFYWQMENLRPNKWDPDPAFDTEAAIAFNDYVHSLGYISLWCPYYSNIVGLYHSLYYGFDITLWQPNHVFSASEPQRLDIVSELAKIYGIGVEIEVEPNKQSKESLERYREYLKAGVKYGFIDSINAYYQGAIPGMYIEYSDSEYEIEKAIFDESILYLKNRLNKEYYADTKHDLSGFEDAEATVKHGKQVVIDIGEIGDIETRFSLTPIYGNIKLERDGKLTYNAMKRYIGNDHIELTLFDGISETKTIKIDIEITE